MRATTYNTWQVIACNDSRGACTVERCKAATRANFSTAAKFAQLHQPQLVILRAAFMELIDLLVIPYDVNIDCQFLKT